MRSIQKGCMRCREAGQARVLRAGSAGTAVTHGHVCCLGRRALLSGRLLLRPQILTPMQCARFMVFSFPFAADLLSLMTCAAKEAGEPCTHDLLRAAASAKLQVLLLPLSRRLHAMHASLCPPPSHDVLRQQALCITTHAWHAGRT